MKGTIHPSVFIMLLLVGMACMAPSSIAATSDCEGIYFSPDDFNQERPLLKPHTEFMKSYQSAKAGNAVEQRNVAVSYDAGYLVQACPEKAHYWYQKAAQNGDQIARDWLDRYNKFKAMHDEPEFMVVNKTDPPQVTTGDRNIAATSSGTSSDTGKEATYKCTNVLDGSDYYSSKPCPKILGRSLVSDIGWEGASP